jgi:hypothetical protein
MYKKYLRTQLQREPWGKKRTVTKKRTAANATTAPVAILPATKATAQLHWKSSLSIWQFYEDEMSKKWKRSEISHENYFRSHLNAL